jgi:hypothetical protein
MFCYVQPTESWKRSFFGERFLTQSVINLASLIHHQGNAMQVTPLGLIYPEEKGNMFRRNVCRHLQLDLAHQCQRPATSEIPTRFSFSVIYRTKNFFIIFNRIQYWKLRWKRGRYANMLFVVCRNFCTITL